jgi:hypothetical protein
VDARGGLLVRSVGADALSPMQCRHGVETAPGEVLYCRRCVAATPMPALKREDATDEGARLTVFPAWYAAEWRSCCGGSCCSC